MILSTLYSNEGIVYVQHYVEIKSAIYQFEYRNLSCSFIPWLLVVFVHINRIETGQRFGKVSHDYFHGISHFCPESGRSKKIVVHEWYSGIYVLNIQNLLNDP